MIRCDPQHRVEVIDKKVRDETAGGALPEERRSITVKGLLQKEQNPVIPSKKAAGSRLFCVGIRFVQQKEYGLPRRQRAAPDDNDRFATDCLCFFANKALHRRGTCHSRPRFRLTRIFCFCEHQEREKYSAGLAPRASMYCLFAYEPFCRLIIIALFQQIPRW